MNPYDNNTRKTPEEPANTDNVILEKSTDSADRQEKILKDNLTGSLDKRLSKEAVSRLRSYVAPVYIIFFIGAFALFFAVFKYILHEYFFSNSIIFAAGSSLSFLVLVVLIRKFLPEPEYYASFVGGLVIFFVIFSYTLKKLFSINSNLTAGGASLAYMLFHHSTLKFFSRHTYVLSFLNGALLFFVVSSYAYEKLFRASSNSFAIVSAVVAGLVISRLEGYVKKRGPKLAAYDNEKNCDDK